MGLGVLVPIEDLDPGPGGPSDSSYTEAGPGPGLATASSLPWTPIVTGAQTAGIDVLAVRGGYPGNDASPATFAVRLASETQDGSWRGWQEPNLCTAWSAPSDYQAQNWTEFAGAARSDTGEIVVIGHYGSDDARTWSYDPRTETWTTRYDWAAGQGLTAPIMCAPDPHTPGRILLWSGTSTGVADLSSVAYYSDDSGATWSPYSLGVYSGATIAAGGRSQAASHPSLAWLAIANARQMASSDGGSTWDFVEAITAHLTGTNVSIAVGPRGYVVGYRTDTNSYAAVRVLSDATALFSTAVETILYSTNAVENVNVSADDDGTLYAWVTDTTSDTVQVFVSYDGGLTWDDYADGLYTPSATGFGRHDVSVFSHGAAYLIGQHDGAPANGVHALRCGGWSNVDQGGAAARTSRFGWDDDSGGATSMVYLPYDTPANMGWTTSSTGTISMAPATGQGLSLSCTTGQQSVHSFTIGSAAAISWASGEAHFQRVAGPVAASATTLIRQVVQDSATTGYDMRIYLGSNGFEVRDGASTVRATVTIASMSLVELRWEVRQSGGVGRATVWYRVPGSQAVWTRAANDVALTSGAQTISYLTFGVDTAGATTETGTWRMVATGAGSILGPNWRYGLDSASTFASSPAAGVRGLMAGRPLPGLGSRAAVPILGTAGDDVGYLHAVGGPVYARDQHEILVGYRWPISALRPEQSPSPRAGWRATGTAQVDIVYDLGRDTYLGGALALVAVRASFRTATLQLDDGAGSWVTIGSIDLGVDITYTLSGRTAVHSGATTSLVYRREGELVGGYLICGAVARRIVASTAGYWGGSGQQIALTLDGIDGAETASGSGTIVAPSGVGVFYPSSGTRRRYIRVQIGSAQVVPPDGGTDGATIAYGAGILHPYRVIGVGSEASWTPSRQLVYGSTVSRRRDGSPTVTRRGPSREIWTYDWGQIEVEDIRARLGVAVTTPGGLAIGQAEDAWSLGHTLSETLRGGELPCVLVSRLPAAAGTVLDRSMWLYGFITSRATVVAQTQGTEGTDEIVTVTGLVAEEIA
jgi:hypothetical protein